MIIRTRRRLIEAALAHAKTGVAPGVDNPAIYGQRSGEIILPRSTDVWEATKDLRKAFVKQEVAPLPRASVR